MSSEQWLEDKIYYIIYITFLWYLQRMLSGNQLSLRDRASTIYVQVELQNTFDNIFYYMWHSFMGSVLQLFIIHENAYCFSY